ncbi:MAG: hypothetical protein Q4C10_01330 [Clostridia bacterium]|nr:hypothetical protein [Clostridia bacterium]
MPRKKLQETIEKNEEALAVAEIETKKAARSTARKAKTAVTKAVETVAGDVKEAADKAIVATEIEAGKAKAKRTRKTAEAKEAVKTVTEKAKTTAKRAKAAKLSVVIQSPMGGNITADEIAAKIPADAESVFVRVDQNKLWWVKKDGETGSVDIW